MLVSDLNMAVVGNKIIAISLCNVLLHLQSSGFLIFVDDASTERYGRKGKKEKRV